MAYCHKTASTENRERILKAVREKTTYKGKPIKITADFSTETLKSKKDLEEGISSTERKQFQR
jgi:hypothetical protein